MRKFNDEFVARLGAKMHDAVISTTKVECANRWMEVAIIIIKSVAKFTGDNDLMKTAEKLESHPYIWLCDNDSN